MADRYPTYWARRYVRQTSGYRAFIRAVLPYDPPLVIAGELALLHSEADRSIGRLDREHELVTLLLGCRHRQPPR